MTTKYDRMRSQTPAFGKLRTGRKPTFKPSMRETLAQNNAADRYYAAMAGVEPQAQSEIAPKRAHTKREKEPGELSELQEQIRVVKWWDANCHLYKLPPVALFAIPNGGGRGMIEAANLKRSGVRAGVEDLFLAVPMAQTMRMRGYNGMFLEMKIVGGRVEMEQSAMHELHRRHGYRVEVVWSHPEAIAMIQNYLGPI